MNLEYVFIKNYRNIESQGFNFSNKFNINYNEKINLLTVNENPFYIKDFYGNVVSSLSGIIGQNGVGKTTILNYIKEVISFPISINYDSANCLLVFFKETEHKIIIATVGYRILKDECKYPGNLSVEILDLSDLLQKTKPYKKASEQDSILSCIDEYKDNDILHLSNVFDAHSERDYGPKMKPIVYNFSINYLTHHEAVNAEEKATYKVNEIYKIIKLVLNSKHQIPFIKLPKLIRINFRDLIINKYLTESENYKFESTYKDPFREEITSSLKHISLDPEVYASKLNRSRFWLSCYLLIQISEYFKGDLVKIKNVIGSSNNTNLQTNLLSFFSSTVSDFSKESKDRRTHLYSNFSWKEYFDNYASFSNGILNLCINHDQSQNERNSISVKLNATNEISINNIIQSYEKINISSEILSFSWHDLSTGEVMLLRFFANIYNYLTIKTSNKILLLIDEIETFYHPEWQKKIIKTLIDFLDYHFKGNTFQIIFTSHSPITISDIPKSNLIFLKKEMNKVVVQSKLNDHKQTFAANIHTLLSDSFFLKDGLIGDFANSKISNVIDILVDGKLNEVVDKREYIESIINIIGEPVIKAKLLELLENRLRANLLSIKKDLDDIKLRRNK